MNASEVQAAIERARMVDLTMPGSLAVLQEAHAAVLGWAREQGDVQEKTAAIMRAIEATAGPHEPGESEIGDVV